MRRFLLAVVACALVLPSLGAPVRKIKVACIGDSITYGAAIEDRVNYSYPSQLQVLLGENYEVGNFGRSGATLLRHGHRPRAAPAVRARLCALRGVSAGRFFLQV